MGRTRAVIESNNNYLFFFLKMEFLKNFDSLGRLFYIVSPNQTTFKYVREVPNYIDSTYTDLVMLVILEIFISRLLKKPYIRINDSIANLSQGMLMEFTRIFVPGGRVALYMYIHLKFRLVDLPWNSPVTWWICFLGVDFVYYWTHRGAHTINILWATHIVHHSSEDYNIMTNVRQSILQAFLLWMLYLPLALIVPVTAFLVHLQFSYIYQFWIHTELIRSLGPLEYILNTPSHHRVHHGANKNSIDKNFGGTLIIWDRLFGTFEAEKEEIVYGLTHPVGTFGIMQIQFNYCVDMYNKCRQYKGWKNKLSVFIKGPGWSPGKPWLGDPKDIPEIKAPAKKYNPYLPGWCKIYTIWHFFLIIQGYSSIMNMYTIFPSAVLYSTLTFEIISLIFIGLFLDRSIYAQNVEIMRCVIFFIIDYYLYYYTNYSLTSMHAKWIPEILVQTTYAVSFFFWMIYNPLYTFYPTKKDSCS
ncbi:alkylglycerol monooxygenase [Nephila pilipes]|uniref:Alkylglycerol monooxygenase n=1 Tax=Nephila pilipes TaxID=299642 RepID=A0A8X6Q227_NEPPI|nr:alkylglycerol monooxygenase [Nephila pilipes]